MSYFTDRRRRFGRTCADCAAVICDENRSGRCRSCLRRFQAADPEFQERRRQGINRKIASDPEYAERLRRNMRRVAQKAAIDPVLTAKRRERGRFMYATYLNTPEVRAAVKASRPIVAAKLRERRMGWCPPELRKKYKRLYKGKRIPAAEARKIIEAEAADMAAVRSPHFQDAIRWLNRIAPVSLQDDGTYRYGNAFLRPAEVISRAKLKGWQEPTEALAA